MEAILDGNASIVQLKKFLVTLELKFSLSADASFKKNTKMYPRIKILGNLWASSMDFVKYILLNCCSHAR